MGFKMASAELERSRTSPLRHRIESALAHRGAPETSAGLSIVLYSAILLYIIMNKKYYYFCMLAKNLEQ